MRAAGIAFDIHPAHVDEDVHEDEAPDTYVLRVAEAKARTIASRFPDRIVLAADTTVVVDGQILGKPRDADDARGMLRLLSGRKGLPMIRLIQYQQLVAVCVVDRHYRPDLLISGRMSHVRMS